MPGFEIRKRLHENWVKTFASIAERHGVLEAFDEMVADWFVRILAQDLESNC